MPVRLTNRRPALALGARRGPTILKTISAWIEDAGGDANHKRTLVELKKQLEAELKKLK